MPKISNREIIDVVMYNENSAIIVEKNVILDSVNQYKVNYYIINFDTCEKEVITKNAYLLKKFGSNYENIVKSVANFVECDSLILSDRRVFVVFPNGESGVFDSEGNMEQKSTFAYNENIVSGIASCDSEYFWSYCHDENCVLRYFSETQKFDMRVGSKDTDTFIRPKHISVDNGDVYVCCDDNKVRQISKNNYIVSDYMKFNETVKRFYKFGKFTLICLANSTYLFNSDNQ